MLPLDADYYLSSIDFEEQETPILQYPKTHLPKGIDAERVVTDNLGQRGFTYPYMRQFSFGINLSL